MYRWSPLVFSALLKWLLKHLENGLNTNTLILDFFQVPPPRFKAQWAVFWPQGRSLPTPGLVRISSWSCCRFFPGLVWLFLFFWLHFMKHFIPKKEEPGGGPVFIDPPWNDLFWSGAASPPSSFLLLLLRCFTAGRVNQEDVAGWDIIWAYCLRPGSSSGPQKTQNSCFSQTV